MRSHVLEGVVRHRRARPVTYSLEHGVYYLALDLDEMSEMDRSLRLLSRGRRNVLSFYDRDHLDPRRRTCRRTCATTSDGTGWTRPGGR